MERTENLQVYKCELCGNIVEVIHDGVATLVCCGEPMKLLEEQTADATTEKHVPVVERKCETCSTVTVKVGSVPHPMEEKHYIEWIQVIAGDRVYRKFLKPGDAPEATFEVEGDEIIAREYCNVHGLWKA